MTYIISVANFKGGVGKTTTVQNLGAGLARAGKRVLLIDSDAQCSLTQAAIPPLPVKYEDTLFHFYQRRKEEGFEVSFKRIEPYENFYIIPGHPRLSEAGELFIRSGPRALRKIIDPIRHKFDYILIDCNPAIEFLTINALTASDYVIIPTLAETLSVLAIANFIDQVKNYVIREENPDLQTLGILITQCNLNPILSRNLIQAIESEFAGKVFKTRVRRNIAISEAQYKKQDVYSHEPESNGTKDYTALTEEVISILS